MPPDATINQASLDLTAAPPKDPVHISPPVTEPTALQWASMTPDQRAAHSRALPRDAHDFADPVRYVQRRAADGSIETVDRATGSAIGGNAGRAEEPAAHAADPVQGQSVRIGDIEIDEASLRDIMARDAAAEVRRHSLPATPEDYEARLPENFQPPAGLEFKIDANDPLIAQARAQAHAMGATQEDFSKMLGIYAAAKVQEVARIAERRNAEVEKLGAAAPQRIDTVLRWLEANATPEEFKPLKETLSTAGHVKFFERMITRLTNQGGASFSQAGRVPDDGKVSDEVYNSWSYSQRKEYAERMSARGVR